MLKPQVGDIVFMAFSVIAMAALMLMGHDRRGPGDPEAEQRSIETYLRQIRRRVSPVLLLALILALSAVAYALVGLYAAAT